MFELESWGVQAAFVLPSTAVKCLSRKGPEDRLARSFRTRPETDGEKPNYSQASRFSFSQLSKNDLYSRSIGKEK